MNERTLRGDTEPSSPLYNGLIGDSHFSPEGSRLWARIVARRLDLLMTKKGVVPAGLKWSTSGVGATGAAETRSSLNAPE